MRNAVRFTLCALAALTLAAAQERVLAQSMTEADVKRLELSLTDAKQDVVRLKSRDARLAATLGKQLDQITEEVTYLKVKMKKEGSVSRSEYLALRDRIDDLRTRAGAGTPAARASENAVTIPVGTLMDVRLQSSLSSGTAQVEDRFEATTVSDVTANTRVAVPAGALVRGVVAAVDKAGRADRKGSLTLTFDQAGGAASVPGPRHRQAQCQGQGPGRDRRVLRRRVIA